ncbi:hypothetical protein HETIRDRAFT_454282 [Heterobasidion irregulare TC 32-1]|uniref:Uncharacterized protein n=1 Tax=Heterobasidion irregulare (strain TC 32-1) TaxID=747525 RepID=W4JZM9_HETIT|nr:uncharacterized protein HETIRDRAFT_454282 [Heterobasidion irregulare TC 32-1]ETW78291.1 hypothetical protein HETIRDRAFT_454282 [Heterobasidion irregulare TC 32-1]
MSQAVPTGRLIRVRPGLARNPTGPGERQRRAPGCEDRDPVGVVKSHDSGLNDIPDKRGK